MIDGPAADRPAVDASQPDALPDGARGGGLIGSACQIDTDCAAIDAFCIFGFCTQPCGGQNPVTNCNEAGVADPNGPLGGIYTCWWRGPGLMSLCWPNGSGAACGSTCLRADEQCIGGRCQYGTGTTPRTDVRCHRDADCASDEACALFGNLDDPSINIRSEGACLYRGQRQATGANCTNDPECGSFMCNSTCIGMCLTDADCSTGRKCSVLGIPYPLWEYASEFVGLCLPWAGSRTACTANSDCASGEACAPYQTLVNIDTQLAVAHACQTLPNPAGANTGAACTMDSQCQSGSCITNAATGLGYCTGNCGNDGDCGGGTSCRPLVVNGLDPSTAADDLRSGFCVSTAVGRTCFVSESCKSCTQDSDCLPAQGVNCVGNLCRDRFGRCAHPCRHDCSPGGTGCPTGFTCTMQRNQPFCQNNQTGECLFSDLLPTLQYEHGMCGDAGTQDLCYYYGRVQQTDVFMCGQACTGGTTCPSIPTSTTPITTMCRTVHEFGITSGTAMTPTQCAPAAAF